MNRGNPAFGKRTDLLARYTILTHKYENDHTDRCGRFRLQGRGCKCSSQEDWRQRAVKPFSAAVSV